MKPIENVREVTVVSLFRTWRGGNSGEAYSERGGGGNSGEAYSGRGG